MSSPVEPSPLATGAGLHDHVLRPRPRRGPLNRSHSSSSMNGQLGPPSEASAATSGRSTPVPVDAPPSVKSLSSARKAARAELKQHLGSDVASRNLRSASAGPIGRRLFPTVEFASRVSHFDPASDYRDFHGFFNLFWIGLAIMAISTALRNLKDTGYPLRVQIWTLFTVKLWHLAVADVLMVATTAIALPVHKHLFRPARPGSFWTWNRAGMALQSVYQAIWLIGWIAVPFVLDWTWTAQVFLLLHTMVLLMKMHSYAFYNGHLSETEKRLRALDNPTKADKAPAYLYPTAENPMGAVAAASSPSSSSAKLKEQGQEETASSGHGDSNGHANGYGHGLGRDEEAEHVDPNDPEVDYLREAIARELTSPMGNVTYPRNLTWANYLDYLLCPTLCYELEYPRVASIDWQSLLSKITATFGCIFLLTVTSEEFILPVLLDASSRLHPAVGSLPPSTIESLLILAESISWLLFPFMLTFLLVFLVIFEYVLGAFAEITRFADRHFYSDWWNSTDWMEFSREWNVPVYSFLRRHVYSTARPHVGRPMATATTFLISALGHEIVMACITKKLRGYGFVAQMMQLPIVMLQRTKWVRGRKTLNNVMFWCSMILGLSLICALYVLV